MYVYVFYTSFMTTIRKFSIYLYESQTLLGSSLGRPLLIVLINEISFVVGNMPDFEWLGVICINAFNLKMDLIHVILNILLLSQSTHCMCWLVQHQFELCNQCALKVGQE